MLEKKAEKKVEPEKKSFNNLAMKLTKPPEKKTPVGPGSKSTPASKPPVKNTNAPVPKAGGSVDILDLDFNAMSISQPTSSSSADPMDLLGGSSEPTKPTNNNNFDLFGQTSAQALQPQSTQNQNVGNFSFDMIQKPEPVQPTKPSQINYQQHYNSPAQNFNMLGGQPVNNSNIFGLNQSSNQSQSTGLNIHL